MSNGKKLKKLKNQNESKDLAMYQLIINDSVRLCSRKIINTVLELGRKAAIKEGINKIYAVEKEFSVVATKDKFRHPEDMYKVVKDYEEKGFKVHYVTSNYGSK